jgi:sulfite reductase alpha subunit-like flavoprotein
MSAADDVFEMNSLCTELADRLAGHGATANKARVAAVSKEIGVGWNRALEFLSGKARRVDAWEKEHAKRRIAELRDAERRRLENNYLDWLQSSHPDLRGPMLDRLELVLRNVRGGDSAVEVQEAAEHLDQSKEWPGV